MTTTMTDQYLYERTGTSFAGTPLWQVSTPTGAVLGFITKLTSKRGGSSWSAIGPSRNWSQGGFRNREVAAKYLEEIAS